MSVGVANRKTWRNVVAGVMSFPARNGLKYGQSEFKRLNRLYIAQVASYLISGANVVAKKKIL